MLTVNSSLRLMNSLVPSSGSTSQKMRTTRGLWPAATSSSATTGICGVSGAQAERMKASPVPSASVTGVASSLLRAESRCE
jgi:hypothetical protein